MSTNPTPATPVDKLAYLAALQRELSPAPWCNMGKTVTDSAFIALARETPFAAHAASLAELERENARLREAAQALVDKVNEIRAEKTSSPLWAADLPTSLYPLTAPIWDALVAALALAPASVAAGPDFDAMLPVDAQYWLDTDGDIWWYISDEKCGWFLTDGRPLKSTHLRPDDWGFSGEQRIDRAAAIAHLRAGKEASK